MKTRLAAGFAASVLLGMPAFAADLPVKAFTKAPALAAYDWTGFYLGVNVGLGVARNETTWAIPAANSLAKTNLGPFGAIGGAQVGYNWQWRNLVFGLETDFQGAGVTENRFCGDTCVDGTAIRIEQKLDWFGTARARLGLATGPVLSYVTGGLAYGNVKTTFSDDFGGPVIASSFSETRVGWTVGSGVEASLGGNWTGKLEYLLLDLGKQSGTYLPPGFASSRTFSTDIREQVIRAGVNYRIGGTPAYAALPALNWAGVYVGANIGGALARDRSSATINNGLAAAEKFDLAPKGVLGGAQIGYNWQAANWVFGLETDIQGSSLKENDNCELSCDTGLSLTIKQTLPWLGTTRGRLGYSVGPSLFYVTGGAAYGEVKNKITEVNGGTLSTEFAHTKSGWTVGAGVETPFEFFGLFGPNWTSKTEYLFVDLGKTTDSYVFAGNPHVIESRVQEHIFRGGLNYHFNTLVAR